MAKSSGTFNTLAGEVKLNGKGLNRFWKGVNKQGAIQPHKPEIGCCWQWCNGRGWYGVVCFNGKTFRSHRISWIIHNGQIPKGLWVLHKCDNKGCVRPDHLFLGTRKDNESDKISKGRQARGDKNYQCRLKESEVVEIRQRRNRGETLQSIADRFHITKQAVWRIVHLLNWKHVI